MKINRITIAGLGLIGGSLAKAFRRTNPDFFIAAVDTNKDDLDAAVAEGIIDHSSTAFDHVTVKSQVVFLCTPLKTLPALLESLAGLVAEGTIITDTASVKAPIMRAAKDLLPEGVHFIGGHPMSGTEQSGYAASISHLFENAYYIMT
ncbi:MAG TPA: prephenate dehydrogenase/arogenate dehydrogenase family protein, partial [Bacillota bacterium]|nr:prephenate dehydrogenase/arogenate dehydrogenase family protein [Bacillota bacterium]